MRDAREFRGLAEKVHRAFNRRFWDDRTGGYASNNQACNSVALYMGLVPDEKKASVLANIVKDVEDHDFHLTTGNLCTKYIFDVLSDGGEIDTAYRLLTQSSYPSWGYMFERGATTMWERWEEATGIGMNSHNHGMYASIGAWLYKALAGIRVGHDCSGFSNVVIAPKIPSGLKSVDAAVDTVRGSIETSWENCGRADFSLTVSLPPGVDAEVHIPRSGQSDGQLTEGGTVVSEGRRVRYFQHPPRRRLHCIQRPIRRIPVWPGIGIKYDVRPVQGPSWPLQQSTGFVATTMRTA